MSDNKVEATQVMDESKVDDFDFDAFADEVLGYAPEEATQEEVETTEELESAETRAEEDAEEVDEVEDEVTEEEVEDEDESEDATQEEETEDLEDYDIDMTFEVPVKIDGEESNVTMEELVTNYQTKQHQSKKGDELAVQAKELEQARNDNNLYMQINQELLGAQDQRDLALLKQRKDVMDEMAKEGFVEGVDEDLSTLQYQFNNLKDEYQTRKAGRDATTDKMIEAAQAQYQESMQGAVESFQKEIVNHVPDWSQDIAEENYKFAIDFGLPEELVATITDPSIAKFIDEFRRLKTSASKGAVKRKKAPVKRVPTKKPVSKSTKTKNDVSNARKRIAKGKGSQKDQDRIADGIFDDLFD